jgi:DNA primase
MISKQTIDKIFSTIRVEEIVGEYVQLKRAGSNYKGLSPFHEENLQVLSFRQVNRSGKISQPEKEEQRSLS